MQVYQRVLARRPPTSAAMQEIGHLVFEDYNKAIARVPFEERPERPTSLLNGEIAQTMHVGSFVAHGRNIFFLAPHIVQMLEQTDLSGVQLGDIRLPFPVIFVAFGDAFSGSLPGPPNQIDGAYLIDHGNGMPLQVMVTCRRLDVNPARSSYWPFSRDQYYFVPFETANPQTTFEVGIMNAIASRELVLAPDSTAPDPDFKTLEIEGRDMLVRDVSGLTEADTAKFNSDGLEVFSRALSLAINAVCYINARNDDDALPGYPSDAPDQHINALARTNKRHARQRIIADLLSGAYYPVRLLGASDQHEGMPRGLDDEAHKSVRNAHWRRGHWRRQAVGVGKAERRLIWIKPTIVGADAKKEEQMPGRIYKVE